MQIKYINIQKYPNIGFSDYLQFPGHSHSGLKSNKNGFQQTFIPTDKVRVGKMVDEILTNNSQVIDILNPLYQAARDISEKMKSEIGENTLKFLTFQNSYTATMQYEDLELDVKGRNDAELKKLAVIDFKVTENAKTLDNCIKLIQFMGYDNQIFNYGGLAEVRNHFLFIYSKKIRKTFFIKRLTSQLEIDLAENWWINKIVEHGKIKSSNIWENI